MSHLKVALFFICKNNVVEIAVIADNATDAHGVGDCLDI